MIIDLHIHTKPLSPCSNISPEEAINEAKRIGLDGIVFTEHNKIRSKEQLIELQKKYNFLVLQGNEFTTLQGDVLVYGSDKSTEEIISVQELRDMVGKNGVFVAAAHPFREFLVVGIGALKLSIEDGADRPIFKFMDGIEIKNGRVSDQANKFAFKVNEKLQLIGIGGSDAHELYEIGKIVTEFQNEIRNELDLVNELYAGRFKVKKFRK
ncbi:MAG: PHP-associated domain-containing protein [Promethearchaeota archaeon]